MDITHGSTHDRHGARQKEHFDPARASLLDDPARFKYLQPKDVLEMLNAPQGARVVDFGAGTGTYAIELAKLRPDLEILALDEQPAMLDHMRAKVSAAELPNLKLYLPDQMAGLEGKIDRVMALNVLHEASDKALANLRALLSPEGSALIVDWSSEVNRPVGPPRDHVYSAAEARERLEKAGFRIELERRLRFHYAFRVRPQ